MLPLNRASRPRHLAVAAVSLATVATLGACSSQPAGPQKTPFEVLQGKVGTDAVAKMTRADFSKTYSRLGASQFENANDLMRWAAIAAAESDQCTEVEVVAVSDSATRKNLQWFADCANGERFMISQEQAVAAQGRHDPKATPDAKQVASATKVAEPKSARWKDFDEATTVSVCDLTVQNAMLVPRSFSTGWNRWNIDKNDETGVVIIERDYETENAYGMTLNSRYRCAVDTNKKSLVGLSIREPDGWQKLI